MIFKNLFLLAIPILVSLNYNINVFSLKAWYKKAMLSETPFVFEKLFYLQFPFSVFIDTLFMLHILELLKSFPIDIYGTMLFMKAQ